MVKNKEKRNLQESSAVDYFIYFTTIIVVLLLFLYSTFQLNVKYLVSTTKNNLYFIADSAISMSTSSEDHTFNRKDIIVNYNDDISSTFTTPEEKQELTEILNGMQDNFEALFHLDSSTHIANDGVYKEMCKDNRVDIVEVKIYQPIYKLETNADGNADIQPVTNNKGEIISFTKKYTFDYVRVYTIVFHNGQYIIPSVSEVKPADTFGDNFNGAKIDLAIELKFYGVKKIFAEASSPKLFAEIQEQPIYGTYRIYQSLDVVLSEADSRRYNHH